MKSRDICFTELSPQEQAAWRAARQQHSTFSSASPAIQTPRSGNSNVCIDDLTLEERAKWRENYKARM